jgi:polysaccharide export outer membrane protein
LFAVVLTIPASPQTLPSASGDRAAVDQDLAAISTMWGSGRYRVTPGDVLQLGFPYVPEFDQTVTVQPDGYIALRGISDLRVAGQTIPDIRTALIEAYEPLLRAPVMTIVLKEFEHPYFIAAGQVARPGKYDLRGATTMSEALALAGGPARSAKDSEVVLFRRHTDGLAAVAEVNVKKMYKARDLSEDPILRPGDTVFVPKSSWSAISSFLPRPGIVLNPFFR